MKFGKIDLYIYLEVMMEDFQMTVLNNGDIVEGEVISVTPTYAYINVNYMMDALLELKNYSFGGEITDLTTDLKIGDKVKVQVVRLGEEMLVVSKNAVARQEMLNNLEVKASENAIIEVTFTQETQGGLVGRYMGINAFMPKSHTDTHRVEEFTQYLNKPLQVQIIEFESRRNKLVVSQRNVLEVARKKAVGEVLSTVEVGDQLSVTVNRLQDNGATVLYKGMEAWLPIRELTHHRGLQVSEVISTNETIDVKVVVVDLEKGRLIVSKKALEKSPWTIALENIKIGNTIEGKILDIIGAGAIVEVSPGVAGLLHTSEFSYDRHEKLSQSVKANEIIRVKVIGIDESKHRLSLSVKQLEASPWSQQRENLKVGKTVQGTIKKVMDRVAFVEIFPLIDAVLTLKEATIARANSMHDVVTEGQVIDAVISNVNNREEKVEISIVGLEKARDRKEFQDYQTKVQSESKEDVPNVFANAFANLENE